MLVIVADDCGTASWQAEYDTGALNRGFRSDYNLYHATQLSAEGGSLNRHLA